MMAKGKIKTQAATLFELEDVVISTSSNSKVNKAAKKTIDITLIGLNACYAKYGCIRKQDRNNTI